MYCTIRRKADLMAYIYYYIQKIFKIKKQMYGQKNIRKFLTIFLQFGYCFFIFTGYNIATKKNKRKYENKRNTRP